MKCLICALFLFVGRWFPCVRATCRMWTVLMCWIWMTIVITTRPKRPRYGVYVCMCVFFFLKKMSSLTSLRRASPRRLSSTFFMQLIRIMRGLSAQSLDLVNSKVSIDSLVRFFFSRSQCLVFAFFFIFLYVFVFYVIDRCVFKQSNIFLTISLLLLTDL